MGSLNNHVIGFCPRELHYHHRENYDATHRMRNARSYGATHDMCLNMAIDRYLRANRFNL